VHCKHETYDQPSAWVSRFAESIPEGEVLDLACGSGRHSRFFASLGHTVLAVDRNTESLKAAAGSKITTLALDLETEDIASSWPFAARFSGIVVTNYLHRPLWPLLVDSLAPEGILIYETFAVGNEQFGKPSNPDFLLARGELLSVAAGYGLHVIAFEDGCVTSPKPAVLQRICMAKTSDGHAARRFVLD